METKQVFRVYKTEECYKNYEEQVLESLKKINFENNQEVALRFIKQYIIETKLDPFIEKLKQNKTLFVYLAEKFRNKIINEYFKQQEDERN